MLTKASFALVAALVLASASQAFAARSTGSDIDVRNSTFNIPSTNEEGRLDHAKGLFG